VIALTSAGKLKRSYTADIALLGTRGRRLGAVLLVAVLLVIPAFASNFQLTILNLVAMASLGAMALNLLIGVAGQVSIGTAAFLAIGSFTAAFLGVQQDLPFMIAVPGAAVAAAVVGAPSASSCPPRSSAAPGSRRRRRGTTCSSPSRPWARSRS
jgi:branched-chain amino acid transport system permease protein